MSWANAEIKSTHRLWESWQIKILTNKIVTCWYSEIIIKESSKLYITFVLYFLVIMLRLPYWFDKKKLELCFTKDQRCWQQPLSTPGIFFSTGFCIFQWVTCLYWSICSRSPHFISPGNSRKPKGFKCFWGYKMEMMARKALTKFVIARWGPAQKISYLLACWFMRRNTDAMNTNIVCVLIRNL